MSSKRDHREKETAVLDDLRGQFEKLAKSMEAQVQSGRALSLAQTKLDEASMWLRHAIDTDGLK